MARTRAARNGLNHDPQSIPWIGIVIGGAPFAVCIGLAAAFSKDIPHIEKALMIAFWAMAFLFTALHSAHNKPAPLLELFSALAVFCCFAFFGLLASFVNVQEGAQLMISGMILISFLTALFSGASLMFSPKPRHRARG